ncbi:MAG: phosphodiester glycosidase family protein [Eubacteriales bacterium]|nr:phosphodiester glycosidase family protein [Eubacteriales bacterium]
MKRKIISYTIATILALTTLIPKTTTFANTNLLYSESDIQTITSGVTYEESRKLYKSGWKDVYVLTVDVRNPNVKLEILESATEYGLKKSTENLVKENGAIAGINGDFFGSGNPKSAMGQVIENGNEYEAQNYYNNSENKYAGIFLDTFGNVFVDYMKSNIRLYNSKVNLDLGAKNKITDFKKPVIFDRTAITTTADLDKRNSNLFKVVVENGVIKQKLGAGEVATVPENGYIVVMDKNTASTNLVNFDIGATITFTESYKFAFRPDKDIKEIVTGVSAGGEILRNGKVVSQGMSISPNTRQPRTAVGVSQDKSKLIMMVVDGRGTSVGATHNEMAELLLEYGAYDAIHFDGGGSSTMIVREEGDTQVSLTNNVSEKTQRSVPNGLGIKTTNPTGELASLKIEPTLSDGQAILAGGSYGLKIYGFDANKNPVAIDNSQVSVSFATEDEGTATSSSFKPNKAGELTLKATHKNGATGEVKINVKEAISGIRPKASSTSLKVSGTSTLSITGINNDGYELYIDPSQVVWTVDNQAVGNVKGNVFTATGNGLATLTATYGSYTGSITIAVGESPALVEGFENPKQMFMMYYPENAGVSGGAAITNSSNDGSKSLLLSYSFKENSQSSQASYVCFEKSPIVFSGQPSYIEMTVKGDASGNMLKSVIKDKNNKQYIVPIIENMNSNNWTTVRFAVPKEVAYPIRLDKLYVGTYATTAKEQGNVYIDNISGVVPRTDGGKVIGGYTDPLSASLKGTAPLANEEDINIFGQTANKPYANSKQVLTDAINAMKVNATSMIFVGSSNLEGIATGVSTIQWQNKYSTSETKNLSVINLATKSGNMRTESPDQWRWLQSYLNSFSKNNIVINMDKNIWDSNNNLTGERENEIFHKILKEFVEETGKKVLVVSAVGDKSQVYTKDGIRYITLNGLTNSNSSDLTNYKYLKIRAS